MSQELLAPLGVVLPIRPTRHTIAIVQRSSEFQGLHPIVGDRVTGAYFRPERHDLTLIGLGRPLESPEDPEVELHRPPDPANQAEWVKNFLHRFPGEQTASLRRGYTGVYDCTPDLQAVIGPAPNIRGLFIAAGFSGHGFKFTVL